MTNFSAEISASDVNYIIQAQELLLEKLLSNTKQVLLTVLN